MPLSAVFTTALSSPALLDTDLQKPARARDPLPLLHRDHAPMETGIRLQASGQHMVLRLDSEA